MKLSRRRFVAAAAGAAGLAAPWTALSLADEKIPILFDTDIGTDIDDALTLVYLLSQPRCELAGVTTVYGDTVDRARLASAVCRAAGREVPIHPGSPRLMSGKTVAGKVPQAAALPNWPHRSEFEPDSAVEFMHRTIRSRPGEITLLAVGPLTNVARLFERYPEAPTLLKGLTLMNGSFRILYPEYNAALDPEATRTVYATRVPALTAIDFETSLQCRMGKREARERVRGGALAPVADMLEVWFKTLPVVIFYDSIAAVSIFEPGLVTLRSTAVKSRWGRTFPSPGPGPHLVSIDVDQERFKKHYFETVEKTG